MAAKACILSIENKLISDYVAFDQAWNEGLRRYEAGLRQAIGPDKIIFVNWGMANFDLLNGNNPLVLKN